MKLQISEEENNSISKLARERKFSQDKNILYSENNVDLMKNFIKSYGFLNNLNNNLGVEFEKISEKIRTYLENYKEIFYKSHNLLSDLESDVNYGKGDVINNINSLMNENKEKVMDFINSSFPIGRYTMIYDPDENVGIQQ